MSDTSDVVKPGAVIGYWSNGRPILLQAGGAEDDEDSGLDLGGDDSEDESDEDVTEKSDADSESDDYTPPTKEEWAKLQAERKADAEKLRKANADARDHRLKLRELQRAQQKAGAEGDDAAAKAAAKALEDAEEKYKPQLVRLAAKAAFTSARLADTSPAGLNKAIRLLDMDKIAIDDDGEVLYVDDQVEELKESFPGLFDKDDPDAPKPPRVPRLSPAGKKPAPAKKYATEGERIAARVHGE